MRDAAPQRGTARGSFLLPLGVTGGVEANSDPIPSTGGNGAAKAAPCAGAGNLTDWLTVIYKPGR